MTKYEIGAGEEFPLGARLAQEFEERARGFTGRFFIGGLLFVSLAAIAVSHPVAMLATILGAMLLVRAHRRHHRRAWRHAHRGYYERYWRRDGFDEDFL
ncbi:MAG: hypothetical protein P4L72_16600 [Parvibaculum sp.]|jgi:hypothetical protein|uniref:hypothetical protein n=1 Tax=Parvibaculum sp. TaxID=2024848 RepID=UPI0028496796|nr:hypothetical protein [Parvibaculum sp.]MDR3500836.1 hypothetical protein [Parvibaculum sp.]